MDGATAFSSITPELGVKLSRFINKLSPSAVMTAPLRCERVGAATRGKRKESWEKEEEEQEIITASPRDEQMISAYTFFICLDKRTAGDGWPHSPVTRGGRDIWSVGLATGRSGDQKAGAGLNRGN